MSQTCTLSQVNSDDGCLISINFNSSSKIEGSYSSIFSVSNIPLSITAQVIPLINKGSSPNYFITTSNGEVITFYNFGSFSKFLNSSNEARFYIRDANRIINQSINYSFQNATTSFTSNYSTCSASALKSASGCLMREYFSYYNKTEGNYSVNLVIDTSLLFELSGNVNLNNPYSKSPNYAFIDNNSGKILSTLNIDSDHTSSQSTLKTFILKDLNSSSFPTTGVSFLGLSNPLTFSYNQCASNSSVINTTGCTIKISGNFNVSPGSYNQMLETNIGIQIPAKLNILGNQCVPNSSNSCLIAFGSGTQICNESGTDYGSCSLSSCIDDYHEENGICLSNTRNCAIENGSGMELWLGNQWSYQCNLVSCNPGFHSESNTCLSNIKNINISYGVGSSIYNGRDWSPPDDISCNAGYHNEYGQCVYDIKQYFGPPIVGSAYSYLQYVPASSTPDSPFYTIKNTSCISGFWMTPSGSCQSVADMNNGNILLDGGSEDPVAGSLLCGVNFTFDKFDSILNKTFCKIKNIPYKTINLIGNLSCPSGYSKISYSQDTNLTLCQTTSCQPFYEIKKYTVYTDNSQISWISNIDTPPSGKTKKGFCEKSCNPDGLSFGDCKEVSCSAGFYFNDLKQICEEGVPLNISLETGDPSSNIPNGYISFYHSPIHHKYYVKINNTEAYFKFINTSESHPHFCSQITFSDPGDSIELKEAKQLECKYTADPNSSLVTSAPYYILQNSLFLGLSKFPSAKLSILTSAGNKIIKRPVFLGTLNPYVFNPENPPSLQYLRTDLSYSPSQQEVNTSTHICTTGYRRFLLDTTTTNCISDRICTPPYIKLVASGLTTATSFSCNYTSFVPNTQTLECLGNYHMENGVCVDNIKVCSLSELPEGISEGYKHWQGSSYSSCIPLSCQEGMHSESLYGTISCVSNIKTCMIPNGSGFQLWSNYLGWNSCQYQSCNSNYHAEEVMGTTSCVSNFKDCRAYMTYSSNAIQTWTGNSYGACTAVSCINDFHVENNLCTDNIKNCSISNGIATQSWNFETNNYNECSLNVCNNSYSVFGNSCTLSSRFCSISNGEGVELWDIESQSYSSCEVTSCNPGYEQSSSNCIYSLKATLSKETITSGESIFITVSGGTGSYSYQIDSGYIPGSTFENGSFTVGTFDESISDRIMVIKITDSLSNSIIKNITVKPTHLVCTPSLTTYPGSTSGYRDLDTSTMNYESLCYPSSCNSTYYELYQKTCVQTIRACDPEDSNKTESALASFNYNASPSEALIGRGNIKWVSSLGEYSPCYSNKCKTNNQIYSYSDYYKKCENIHYCTDEELNPTPPNFQANALYTKSYNVFSQTWDSSCNINPLYPCKPGFITQYQPGVGNVCVSEPPPECSDLSNSSRLSSSFCNDYSETLPNFQFYSLDLTTYPKAQCYDGTPGGFFFRKGYGSGTNRWIIALQGGGVCGTIVSKDTPQEEIDACLLSYMAEKGTLNPLLSNQLVLNKDYVEEIFNQRQLPLDLFSEAESLSLDIGRVLYPNSDSLGNIGILDQTKNINPDFYSWNHVLIKYCSQDVWTGNSGINGKHNGYNIMKDSIDYLINNNLYNMNHFVDAKNIIFSGYSAGGIGIVYSNTELIDLLNNPKEENQPPRNTDISFFIDSGFMNDYNLGNSFSSYIDGFHYNAQNTWNSNNYSGNPSQFVNPNINLNNTFVLGDILDFEYLNYNARQLNTAINLADPLFNALFKELYICNSNNLSNSYISNEWSNNGNDSLLLSNFLNHYYNTNGVIKSLATHSGLYLDKGRHSSSFTSDWNRLGLISPTSVKLDSGVETTIVNPESIRFWFGQWYFNKDNEILHNVKIYPSKPTNLPFYLQNQCSFVGNQNILFQYLNEARSEDIDTNY